MKIHVLYEEENTRKVEVDLTISPLSLIWQIFIIKIFGNSKAIEGITQAVEKATVTKEKNPEADKPLGEIQPDDIMNMVNNNKGVKNGKTKNKS